MGFNVSDTLLDSVGQDRHHLYSMGLIVQCERRQDLAQMEEAWGKGKLKRPGEKSMKQGKERACAKGQGCEGAWRLQHVRVLGPDQELDAGLQNSTYPLSSVMGKLSLRSDVTVKVDQPVNKAGR